MIHNHALAQIEFNSETIGIAFAICLGAGAASLIGASLMFCIRNMDKKWLTVGLSFSAGVMLYVSFVEIFVKSMQSYEAHHIEHQIAYVYTTLTVAAGVVASFLLDVVVHAIAGLSKKGNFSDTELVTCPPSNHLSDEDKVDLENAEGTVDGTADSESVKHTLALAKKKKEDDDESEMLTRLGIFSAIAITLHNIPEGMATFAAAMVDPGFGGVIALAIGLHNLPEGLAVALPIYYATGSRMKAFLASVIAGVAEPLGGLVTLGILYGASDVPHLSNGVLFGMVCGIMLHISFAKLLPISFKYDPKNKVTTTCTFAGMTVMGLSLIVFEIAGSSLHEH